MFDFKRLAIVFLLFAYWSVLPGFSLAQEDADTEVIIRLGAESEVLRDWLALYPGYQAIAHGPDEESNWYVEFYDSSGEAWLGYAIISADEAQVLEAFAPKPLPPDVYQVQSTLILQAVLNDLEVQAWLENAPDQWDAYPEWNVWEQSWYVAFTRGIESVLVSVGIDENDNVWIGGIFDPNSLDEQQAIDQARNEAINLAYQTDGADAALQGHDNWRTYVERVDETQWSVSFVSGEDLLFFVVVEVK